MHSSFLEQFVVSQIFTFLLIFCRMGSGIMIMPGIGEAYVPPRVRLLFALMVSLLLTPVFEDQMPDVPGSPLSLTVMMIAEILVGVFLGFLARMMISVLHISGTVIAMQSSLAMASLFDATMASQSTVIGNLLTITAVMLFFSMDIHHIMLNGLADSYTLFIPGEFPVIEDMSNHLFQTMESLFTIALQLASPHIVFSLLFYLAAGILSRLMPAMQVFFVFMPAQLMAGIFLLMAIFTSLMVYYTNYVQDTLSAFMD